SGVRAGLERTLQVLLERRCRSQRVALGVVDHLRVDVLRRTVDRQARTLAGNLLQLTAHALGAALNGFLGGHGLIPCLVKRGWPCAVSQASRGRTPWRCSSYFFLPSLRTMRSPA